MQMKKTTKKSIKYFKDSVRNFLTGQAALKTVKANFEDAKEQFYKDMNEYFEAQELGGNNSIVFDYPSLGNSALKVTRVQKVNVDFDIEKLEKTLPKDVVKRVVVKRYEVANMEGLISYLKKCNVDPHVFKSFLNVTKHVEVSALDKLEELGEVSVEQLKGCYSVRKSNPYYTVSEVK